LRQPQRTKIFAKETCMTSRSIAANFVTAFATGWPENQPDIMVLSLTTDKGVQDFALSKEQALLIAKTKSRPPRGWRRRSRAARAVCFGSDSIRTDQL
jgi:hypothetical protein